MRGICEICLESLKMFFESISCALRQIRNPERSGRGRRLLHVSLYMYIYQAALNGHATEINWLKMWVGAVGIQPLSPGAGVFPHLLIAYWWHSYGSKLTLEHSISFLTSPSQPGDEELSEVSASDQSCSRARHWSCENWSARCSCVSVE